MAYDEDLAERVRRALSARGGFEEKKMFGGVCFMVNGHMVGGVVRDEIMVRVGVDHQDTALGRPHTRPMDFTGRLMRGMVFVEPEGTERDGDLDDWVAMGLAYARSLPPKAPKAPKTPRKARPKVAKAAKAPKGTGS
ncbi:MAG: TfoX/Sxy family protein [Alphaproteobacteria bacterium]|nr:TfoX/Sxy family protein [Alphaproteobacteria bacterium]